MANLRVEVVEALPDRARIIPLELAQRATVGDALAACGLDSAGLAAATGIYGKRVGLDHPLKDRDRIEIYRRLKVEPGPTRRQWARRR